MTRREAVKRLLLGLFGTGGITAVAGCAGGQNEQEKTLATTQTLRIRIRLRVNRKTTKRKVRIPRGSTVLAAIVEAFGYERREDGTIFGTTIINGIRGHWRYAVNNIEPRVYAGSYRLTSNCRLDLRLI